ncbi:MAG: flagellar hook-length control protein FliK [Planctomycetaceae bacterium]|jgi:hypothetical protein|nr:flagellar hook-length control protein FliK [Planctomycetaceae bacterium]
MPIDITTIYQNNSPTKQEQSTETPNSEMLKSVFVTAMQNSLANRMFHNNTSIVDISVKIQDSAAEQKEQQNKNQHESSTPSELHDSAKENKRALNQSEIRQEQITDNYNRKTEQHKNLQTEYEEKKEHRDFVTDPSINNTATHLEKTVSAIPPSTSVSIFPTNSVSPTLSVLPETPNPQLLAASPKPASVPVTPGIIPASFLITASNPNSVALPATQPFTALTASAAPVTTLEAVPVMTIFTASGRFGISKNETEEKNTVEKKKEKEKTKEKKGITSLFGAGLVEITTPVEYKNPPNNSFLNTEPETDNDSVQKTGEENNQDSKSELKPELKSETEEKSEQESEPDENRIKIPPEKWFSENQSVEQSAVKSNEPESFDQLRFIQRVAAACQSAANQHGTIRIKLHLDQLGTVTLRITSKPNKLAIRFEVTSFAAVRRLRNTLGELHTTLAEQNIVLEHTEIDVV